MPSASSSAGFVSLRTMVRSSRSITLSENTPPSAISSWVSAVFSTEMASSLGWKLTWVAQFRVIRLRRSPAREPTT